MLVSSQPICLHSRHGVELVAKAQDPCGMLCSSKQSCPDRGQVELLMELRILRDLSVAKTNQHATGPDFASPASGFKCFPIVFGSRF